MGFFLVIIFLLIIAALVAAPIIIMYSRRQARDQKNFERGLKMVPLLIHLPPISEDTDANGRDVRDLVDENISKAQVIYNLIASTYEKGFKRRLYGQQHFAFEIVSAQGFVYFYTTVPIGLVEVVRQAIVSAYPAARLEEAEEHNIFNNLGKLSGTTGGELVLKESFAYPISTYMDLKRDAMQAMLNSLSTVGKEDGAAIQILLRPADPGWRRTSHGISEAKRKGKDSKGGAGAALGLAKEVGTAFYKPPEAKSEGGSDKPELSEHELAVLNSIDDKTRYPAYEVLIRLVSSSNVSQRSQTILNNMVAAFSFFDAPGKNGFKYEPAKDIDELVTAYIMKFFPQEKNKMILNSVELATIFHFPDQRSIPTTQLERQDSKQVDGPRNMPEEGMLLGYNVFRGVKKPVRLALGDRQRHMYVVGQTGTGKSTFLENLALQDMLAGNGFAFVDPHGDTAEKLLAMVPKERTEDVIYFSPSDMEYPMGVNLFEFDNPDQKDFLIQEALNMLQKLYDPQHQGIMGPRYEHLFRNAALTVMADPAGGTFIDIPKLFRDPQYVKQKLEHVKDVNVLEFWQKEMPQSQRSNEFGEVVSWFVSKFGAFLSNEMMRNIIGQNKSAFNLREVMDNKKILLVNLSKGRLGDLNAKLLGMIFVMKFQAAAMSRANIPEKDRVDFSLYVDEFQNFSTDSFATIMSEARKYHLNLIVANQFTTQLSEEIRDAVFGNMGTIVAFRIGQNDVDSLSRYFQPTFDGDDLLRVPNYNTIVRTLISGVPTQPFSMGTLPPLGEPNAKLSEALKQLTAAKYGRPKKVVEKEIFERIATKEPLAGPGMPGAPGQAMGPGSGGAVPGQRPFGGSPWQPQPAPAAGGFGAAPSRPAAGGYAAPAPGQYGQPAPAPARPGTGSFLDEWMAKRGAPGQPTGAPTTPASPAAAPMVVAPVVPAAPMVPGPGAPTPTPASPAPEPYPIAPIPDLSAHGAKDNDKESSQNNQEDESHSDRDNRPRKKRRKSKIHGANRTLLPNEEPAKADEAIKKPASDPGLMRLEHDNEDMERLEKARRDNKQRQQEEAAAAERERQKRDKAAAEAAAKAAAKPVEAPRPSAPVVVTPPPDKPVVAAPVLPPASEKPVVPVPPPKPVVLSDLADSDSKPEPVLATKTNTPDDAKDKQKDSDSDKTQAEQPDRPKPKVFGLPISGPAVVAPEPDAALPVLTPAALQARHDELAHGDTIYIDQEGNLKPLEEDKVGGDKGKD